MDDGLRLTLTSYYYSWRIFEGTTHIHNYVYILLCMTLRWGTENRKRIGNRHKNQSATGVVRFGLMTT